MKGRNLIFATNFAEIRCEGAVFDVFSLRVLEGLQFKSAVFYSKKFTERENSVVVIVYLRHQQ